MAACEPRGPNGHAPLRVIAGYEFFTTTLINGKIRQFTHGTDGGANRILEMTVIDQAMDLRSIVNRTWSGAIPARRVIAELLAPSGVVPVVRLGEEKVYTSGYSAVGVTLGKALEDVAADTKSVFWQYAGRVNFQPIAPQGFGQAVLLEDNYLLESHERKKLKITAVFNPDIGAGVLVSIARDSGPVLAEVLKGSHRFSTFGAAETEFEARAIS